MPVNACCCGGDYRRPRWCDNDEIVPTMAMSSAQAASVTGTFTTDYDPATCLYFDFEDETISDVGGMQVLTLDDIIEHDDCEDCTPCETSFSGETDDEYLVIPPEVIDFGVIDVTPCSPSVADVEVTRIVGLFWGDVGGSICLVGALSQNAASQVNLTNTTDSPGGCRYWGVGLNWASASYGVAGASWRRWQVGSNVTGIYWPFGTNQVDFPMQTYPLYVETVLP
jgi:hypothetical protein